jgi:hypothetical protein
MGAYGGNPDSIYHYVSAIDKNVFVKNSKASYFKLKQNYPNPFNPSTRITFTLPGIENVTLEIYNTLGQKIEILLNKKMSAGSHEVEFKAQNLSSGIYFYRITAGDFSQMRKMVLVK